MTVNFYGCSSRYETEPAVFVVSFNSSSGTNMVSKYSVNHELFSEKKPYKQLRTKFKDPASYISLWLRATCTQFALTNEKRCTVCIHSNIFQQTRAPIITNMLLLGRMQFHLNFLFICSLSQQCATNKYLNYNICQFLTISIRHAHMVHLGSTQQSHLQYKI